MACSCCGQSGIPFPLQSKWRHSWAPVEKAMPKQVGMWLSHVVICNVVARPKAGKRASLKRLCREFFWKYSEIMVVEVVQVYSER